MGAVGGGMWYLFKGMKNSPPGARLKGAVEVITRNNSKEKKGSGEREAIILREREREMGEQSPGNLYYGGTIASLANFVFFSLPSYTGYSPRVSSPGRLLCCLGRALLHV